jgi:hypothetical protein
LKCRMHIPARASCSSGRARNRKRARRWRPAWLLAATLLSLSGCSADGSFTPAFAAAKLRNEVISVSPLQYWWQAEKADAAERERLWQDAQQRRSNWRLGLLQSLPGSKRYDLDGARKRLRAVIDSGSSADVAALAQLRLEQLRDEDSSQTKLRMLQRRLDEVVAIERKLDGR